MRRKCGPPHAVHVCAGLHFTPPLAFFFFRNRFLVSPTFLRRFRRPKTWLVGTLLLASFLTAGFAFVETETK